ncbi:unnamed protein product [Cylindrotheca closterium]|uniref:SGNH hydrolase-type esterase domain-containing protein n=1 Tax=Cylindrotheca closterium TaxID=2856 RepID=A0AAD2CIW8_9STRA|nr:unnamed protein product [Cylindrotheca closterium]
MPIGLRGAKRRGAGPTEQEMVSLVDKKDTAKSKPKNKTAFPALNRVLPKGGGALDELKVSLLDGGNPSAGGGAGVKAKSIPWDRKRIGRYAALGLASAIVTFLFFNRQRDVHWENFTKMLNPTATGDKKCFYLNKGHKEGTEPCNCPDPTTAQKKTGPLAEQWNRHHDDMVSIAKRLDPNLDIVFLGDSIIERFSGTAGMGAQGVTGHKAAFDRRFSKSAGGRMEGKAFGTEQDDGPNLLWHIKNGLIDNLKPKIWFIMIGNYDLFESKCNEDFVVASIMNVVKVVSEKSPESLFVIHGIMPRLDNPKVKGTYLGKIWKQAKGVNNKLRRFCRKYHNFYYIQGGELMLVPSKITGRAQIDPKMIDDGVHPTLEGFEKWADFVVERLQKVLEDFEKFKAKLEKKKG